MLRSFDAGVAWTLEKVGAFVMAGIGFTEDKSDRDAFDLRSDFLFCLRKKRKSRGVGSRC